MRIFLTLKHWQLFLLTIGVLLLVSLYSGFSIVVEEEYRSASDAVAKFITIVPFLIYYLWIWSIGAWLNKHIDSKIATKTVYFSISIVVSCFLFFFLSIFNFIYWEDQPDGMHEDFWLFPLQAFIIFLAISTWLFALTFLAKVVVRAEREAFITPSEYFSEFVMALMFPIGVWLLQPRINALFEKLKGMEREGS
jgi:hypothetical protein